MADDAELRALLVRCRDRIAETNAKWESHINKHHKPYLRGRINLTKGWWDAIPESAPYGDPLLDELNELLEPVLAPTEEQKA